MSDKNIYAEIDRRLDKLESLGKAGCAEAVTALRQLAEFRQLVHEFSDGETFGWALLDVIDPLIAAARTGLQAITDDRVTVQ
jgi:hypothetical protein